MSFNLKVNSRANAVRHAAIIRTMKISHPLPKTNLRLNIVPTEHRKEATTSVRKEANAVHLDANTPTPRASHSNLKAMKPDLAAMAIDHHKADTTNARKAEKVVRRDAINRTKQTVPTRTSRPTAIPTSTADDVASMTNSKRPNIRRARSVRVVRLSKRGVTLRAHRAAKAAHRKVVRHKADHRSAAMDRKKAIQAPAIPANGDTVLKKATRASDPAALPVNADLPAIVDMVNLDRHRGHRVAEANVPLALQGRQLPMAKKFSKAKSPAIGLHRKKVCPAVLIKPSSA